MVNLILTLFLEAYVKIVDGQYKSPGNLGHRSTVVSVDQIRIRAAQGPNATLLKPIIRGLPRIRASQGRSANHCASTTRSKIFGNSAR